MTTQNPYEPPQVTDERYAPYPVPGTEGTVPAAILEAMRQTRPWVIFLSILGFIATGLMVLLGLGVAAMGGIRELSPAFGLVYVVLALVYVAPALYLFRYAKGIGRLLEQGGYDALTDALVCQKTFWRIIGIMAAVTLGLYFLALVAAVVIGVFHSVH